MKPHKAIFDFALLKTGATIAESVMLGDDIAADIEGARNIGMDQVYVNHKNIEPPFKPTYTITSLKELEDIF